MYNVNIYKNTLFTKYYLCEKITFFSKCTFKKCCCNTTLKRQLLVITQKIRENICSKKKKCNT